MKRTNLPWLTWLVFAALLLVSTFAHANEAKPAAYETGYNSITRLSGDLYLALDAKEKRQLNPTPVLDEKNPAPSIAPDSQTDGGQTLRTVRLSASFVDLLNNISHAKAVDESINGYFAQYMQRLAAQTAPNSFPPVDASPREVAWSFDTMNLQVSRFNQMAGGMVAIEMAHHYLGHYDKYAARLRDPQNQPVPINSLLTPKEWHEAVMEGARTALNCGLGVDGLKTLLQAVESMPAPHPAWVVNFAPQNGKLSKTIRQLETMEKRFFLVDF